MITVTQLYYYNTKPFGWNPIKSKCTYVYYIYWVGIWGAELNYSILPAPPQVNLCYWGC